MSNHAIVRFLQRRPDGAPEVVARVYVHEAQHVDRAEQAIVDPFVDELLLLPDRRVDESAYLAAKFVVHRAAHYQALGAAWHPNPARLDFLGVGIVNVDDVDDSYVVTFTSDRALRQVEVSAGASIKAQREVLRLGAKGEPESRDSSRLGRLLRR